MRSRLVLAAIVAPAFGIGAACTSFDEATPTPTEDAGTEASAAETGLPSDAGVEAAIEGGQAPPTVTSGDFEKKGGLGCGAGWQADKASGELSTETARSPVTSCKVCTTQTTNARAVIFYAIESPPPGLYSVEVYHRAPINGPAPSLMHVQIAAFVGPALTLSSAAAETSPDDTWRPAQTSLRIDSTITKLHIDIGSYASDVNECVHYDDIRLDYTP